MPSYAAGALDAAEREALRAHLATGCPRCALELAEAEATVAQLPLALDPVQPSAAARDRLMARVKSSPTTLRALAPMRIAPAPARSRWLSYAAAACVGALLAALTVQYAYRGIYQNRIARAETELADVKQRLANANTTFAQLKQMINSPDLRLMAFQPTDVQREASGRILWDREGNQWHISVFDMKPPKPGQAYELWFFGQDKKPVPGPMLRVDDRGRGTMTVDVPQDIGPITLAAFTNEPEQGVPQPTGEIHLKSEMTP
jgi:hypothetical protein